MTDPAAHTPDTHPKFIELIRRERNGRTLVCYATKGWYMIVNDDDIARQSVVLTTDEVRWLYWEALGGKHNADIEDEFWPAGTCPDCGEIGCTGERDNEP